MLETSFESVRRAVLRRIPNPRIQTEFRFTLGRALQCGREVVEHA